MYGINIALSKRIQCKRASNQLLPNVIFNLFCNRQNNGQSIPCTIVCRYQSAVIKSADHPRAILHLYRKSANLPAFIQKNNSLIKTWDFKDP